jgi:hypothetical protein
VTVDSAQCTHPFTTLFALVNPVERRTCRQSESSARPDHCEWKFSGPSRLATPIFCSAPRPRRGRHFWAHPATPRPCQPCACVFRAMAAALRVGSTRPQSTVKLGEKMVEYLSNWRWLRRVRLWLVQKRVRARAAGPRANIRTHTRAHAHAHALTHQRTHAHTQAPPCPAARVRAALSAPRARQPCSARLRVPARPAPPCGPWSACSAPPPARTPRTASPPAPRSASRRPPALRPCPT